MCVYVCVCVCVSFTGLLRRLALFREQNEDDVTVLNYFDELEIHPTRYGEPALILTCTEVLLHWIDIEKDISLNMADTLEQIKELIGEPRNYGNF